MTFKDLQRLVQAGSETEKNIAGLQKLRDKPFWIWENHIHEIVPEEYQKCMVGMKQNLKQTLEIAESAADPKTKLQARAIVNDRYKYIMDITTNGVIVNDAIKYVQSKMDHLNAA